MTKFKRFLQSYPGYSVSKNDTLGEREVIPWNTWPFNILTALDSEWLI